MQHRFDAERLALAHELHDVVGHTLVAINVRAAAAARRARKGGATDGTAALDEIASASAGALGELRTTLKALRATQDGRPRCTRSRTWGTWPALSPRAGGRAFRSA